MREERETEGNEDWSDLDWQAPDEELDHVLVSIEGEKKEVDPAGIEPATFRMPSERSPS